MTVAAYCRLCQLATMTVRTWKASKLGLTQSGFNKQNLLGAAAASTWEQLTTSQHDASSQLS
jgi:hypothetical protein